MLLHILTVLKTGGDYDVRYVQVMRNALNKHMGSDGYVLWCLTDDPDVAGVEGVEIIPLLHRWKGWWSKIEVFRPDLPRLKWIYLDLDTLILGNIKPLGLINVEFAMLRGLNRVRERMNLPSSGVMVGDFYWYGEVYERFKRNPEGLMREFDRNRGGGADCGDQAYITSIVGKNVPKVQDYLPKGFIQGKVRVRRQGGRVGKDTRVVAWSGKPRLHEATEQPVSGYWRLYSGGTEQWDSLKPSYLEV